MTEAVKPVMDFAFKDLGFDQLVFTNAVGNERSRRIKEKTGARLIDVRPAKFVDPSYSLNPGCRPARLRTVHPSRP